MVAVSRAVDKADFDVANQLIGAMAAWDIEATQAQGCPTDDLINRVYSHTPNTLQGKYAKPHALFIARVGDEPAGCVAFTSLGTGVGEVEKLFVDPRFRGRGIGRQLMTTVLANLQEGGCNAARLETVRFMKSAIALYQSFGFRFCEPFRQAPIGLDDITVFMNRDL